MTIERQRDLAEERADAYAPKPIAEITEFLRMGARPRKFEGKMSYRVENAHMDGRRAFYAVLQKFEAAKATQEGKPFSFKWTDAQANVIKGLVMHAINDAQSVYPAHKGWYLWGEVFTGKTTLARALQYFQTGLAEYLRKPADKHFKITDVREMYEHFERVERLDLTMFSENDRLFDDVGLKEEIKGVKKWGEVRDPMAEIMWSRHGLWSRRGLLTYCTSNLPFEKITLEGGIVIPGWIDRFDERLQERLKEMLTPVYMPSRHPDLKS